MKLQLALGAILLSCATSAFAQVGNGFGNGNNFNGNNRGGQNRNATLPLPDGVDKVVSIDAYNTLIAQSKDDDGNRTYSTIPVQHIYSGGIAALFGGASIPTQQFVSPAQNNNGQGRGNFGGSSFGGNSFGGNGFNSGNSFNQGSTGFGQGFNNGNSFNQGFNQGSNGNGFNQGFNNGVSGYNGIGFNQGFNGVGNGQIFQTPNGNIGVNQTSVASVNGRQVPLANGPFFVR